MVQLGGKVRTEPLPWRDWITRASYRNKRETYKSMTLEPDGKIKIEQIRIKMTSETGGKMK